MARALLILQTIMCKLLEEHKDKFMSKFIIKRQDGGISIGNMIDGTDLDAEIAKWNESAISKSVYHQFEDRIPDDKDEYFFEAYDHSIEKGVFVDMEKAKPHHLNKLRKIRQQKFIDLGFSQKLHPEIESGLLSDETKSKLKELRDFPQNMDLSKVTDHNELRYIIPDCLK